MGNDYEKAIGIWNHKVDEIEHKIVPKEGDNLKISRIMKDASKNGIDWLYTEFNNVYFDMVIRKPDVPIPESKHASIKLWIEQNQVQIQKDMLIEFGWSTKEQQDRLDNLDVTDLKKLIGV